MRGGGWRTVVVVSLDELEKGAHDDDDARDGAEAHGHAETNLFALDELKFAEDDPGKEGEQDVNDASHHLVHFSKLVSREVQERKPTHEAAAEVLQDGKLKAIVLDGAEDGSRVAASRDPDRQGARDEDEVGNGDDEPEKVPERALMDNLGQRHGKGDLGPARGDGGQPC